MKHYKRSRHVTRMAEMKDAYKILV